MAKGQRIDKELARYALSGIEAAIEKLQRQASELRSIAGGSAAAAKAVVKRGRSDDHVAFRPAVENERRTVSDHAVAPRKRAMSADARRRISEAQKARWAKQKARWAKQKARWAKQKGEDTEGSRRAAKGRAGKKK